MGAEDHHLGPRVTQAAYLQVDEAERRVVRPDRDVVGPGGVLAGGEFGHVVGQTDEPDAVPRDLEQGRACRVARVAPGAGVGDPGGVQVRQGIQQPRFLEIQDVIVGQVDRADVAALSRSTAPGSARK